MTRSCKPAGQSLALITGPNMAGKSTYIRQVALLALLAHCGLLGAGRSMRLGLTDRIFTRVGASDELARGQSTFMVEMVETANILQQRDAAQPGHPRRDRARHEHVRRRRAGVGDHRAAGDATRAAARCSRRTTTS
jgi:hypothetical protein